MGTALTRVYRKGALEAEGFPVADVSDYLAAIIAVPALVTGYYGMNVPYPGSGETWGVIAATGADSRRVRGPLLPVPPPGLAVGDAGRA